MDRGAMMLLSDPTPKKAPRTKGNTQSTSSSVSLMVSQAGAVEKTAGKKLVVRLQVSLLNPSNHR
jgi:hypothetical protein